MANKSSMKLERPVPPAPRKRSIALSFIAFVLVFWSIGFSIFLADLNIQEAQIDRPDNFGIVVFTGGDNRMVTGMEVLTSGAGSRLLISGVNETSSRDALRDHIADPNNLFDCCVDLDYAARNTIDNAAQSVNWVRAQSFDGLVVVTSYYHMPRALMELHHRDGDLTAIPHRVYPDNYSKNNWWYPRTLRTLTLEYGKYEMALMRIRLANLLDL